MQAMDQTSNQPGWLEQMQSFVLSRLSEPGTCRHSGGASAAALLTLRVLHLCC